MTQSEIKLIDGTYDLVRKDRISSNQIKTRSGSFLSIYNVWKNFRKNLNSENNVIDSNPSVPQNLNVGSENGISSSFEQATTTPLVFSRLQDKIKILSKESVPTNYNDNRAIKLRSKMIGNLYNNCSYAYLNGFDNIDSQIDEKDQNGSFNNIVVDNAPIAVEQENVVEVPVVAEQENAEKTPDVVEQSIVEDIPTVVEQNVVEDTPAVVEQNVVEDTPAVVEQSSVEDTPAVAEQSIVEDTPAAVEQSSVEDTPAVVEQSIVEDTPAVVEQSIVEDTPAVVEQSIVEDTPAAVVQDSNGDDSISFNDYSENNSYDINTSDDFQLNDSEYFISDKDDEPALFELINPSDEYITENSNPEINVSRNGSSKARIDKYSDFESNNKYSNNPDGFKVITFKDIFKPAADNDFELNSFDTTVKVQRDVPLIVPERDAGNEKKYNLTVNNNVDNVNSDVEDMKTQFYTLQKLLSSKTARLNSVKAQRDAIKNEVEESNKSKDAAAANLNKKYQLMAEYIGDLRRRCELVDDETASNENDINVDMKIIEQNRQDESSSINAIRELDEILSNVQGNDSDANFNEYSHSKKIA